MNKTPTFKIQSSKCEKETVFYIFKIFLVFFVYFPFLFFEKEFTSMLKFVPLASVKWVELGIHCARDVPEWKSCKEAIS